MTDADTRWMRAALALARRGVGTTGENPSVGCLIVRDGIVLGRGRTAPGGRPHAEIIALEAVRSIPGQTAQGATAYVTLEPCAHHGKTPPCIDALMGAGIARVVSPIRDPDPRVAGLGFERLRAAGVDVSTGLCREEAETVLAGYLSQRRNGLPSLTLKLASTLDGRIATASGESRWITAPPARNIVHMLRARSDAILVGSGTVLADDPSLDVRIPGLRGRSPVPVVADRRLRTPADARLLEDGRTLILGDVERFPERAAALRRAGARVSSFTEEESASSLLATLGAHGFHTVFCEGGSTLAAALVKSDCVDRLVWFTAGRMLGADARGSVDALGVEALAQAPRLILEQIRRVGPDTMSIWVRRDAGHRETKD